MSDKSDVFWSSVAVLVVSIIAFFSIAMWYAEMNRSADLELCNDELEGWYRSINQCIIDEQGNYTECFLTDWPEIQTLYSNGRC